jgi:hypothetical protein
VAYGPFNPRSRDNQIAQARAAVADIEKQLGHRGPGRPRAVAAPVELTIERPRRTMSASARKRIADAQKKRWAAYNKAKAAA